MTARRLIPLLGVPPQLLRPGLVLVSSARATSGGLTGPRTPVHRSSLPVVVAHERHRGGNSTPLDIPVGDRSGPVTEVQRRIGIAVHDRSAFGARPCPLARLEASPETAA